MKTDTQIHSVDDKAAFTASVEDAFKDLSAIDPSKVVAMTTAIAVLNDDPDADPSRAIVVKGHCLGTREQLTLLAMQLLQAASKLPKDNDDSNEDSTTH